MAVVFAVLASFVVVFALGSAEAVVAAVEAVVGPEETVFVAEAGVAVVAAVVVVDRVVFVAVSRQRTLCWWRPYSVAESRAEDVVVVVVGV